MPCHAGFSPSGETTLPSTGFVEVVLANAFDVGDTQLANVTTSRGGRRTAQVALALW